MTFIPTVDLNTEQGKRLLITKKTAYEICESFIQFGSCYLLNHGVNTILMEQVFLMAKMFHSLSFEEKNKIKKDKFFRGYFPMESSKIRLSSLGSAKENNQMESFVMGFEVTKNKLNENFLCGKNKYPTSIPNFKLILIKYRNAMLQLSFSLLECFSIYFNVDRKFFFDLFKPPTYFLRLQYYPDQSKTNFFGIAPHTDYGFFTLLLQKEITGLEILYNKRWIQAPCITDALLINAGDMLRRISNNLFVSSPHRVLNISGKERFSIPFFFEPNLNACIKPIQKQPSSSITYRNYLMKRIRKNYRL